MGELRYGADKSATPQRSHELLDRLCDMITVLPLGEPVCRHYGSIRTQLESEGRTIGPNDMWIAAHGRSAGHTIVTNNTREFERVPNLQVEDWTR